MPEQIRNYKDLKVWQEAMTLVGQTYRLVRLLPASERNGLAPQMSRAAVSIPANIAEGHGSSHRRVFLNHLSISKGSLMELETYLILTVQLQLLSAEQVKPAQEHLVVVTRMMHALIRALRPPQPQLPKP
jgi:four helix bundle protein